MAAPVLQAHTSYRLSLTKAGAAGVDLDYMVVSDGGGITSWSVTRVTGTAGIWTTPTDGTHPTLLATGVSAGTWTFTVTASNSVETSAPVTLTITVPASPVGYTISTRAERAAVSTGGTINASKINGRTVQLATGSTDFGVLDGTTTSGLILPKWRCDDGYTCTIEYEDPTAPCALSRVLITCVKNIDIDGLRLTNATRYQSGTLTPSQMAAQKGWHIRTTGFSLDAPDVTGLRLLNGCGVDGPGDPTDGIFGLVIEAQDGSSIQAEIADFSAYWVSAGISAATSEGVVQVDFTGRTTVRYFTQNAIKFNTLAATSYFYMDKFWVMSAMTDSTLEGVHADTLQVQSGTASTGAGDLKNVRINELVSIQADGDHQPQYLFSKANPYNPSDYSLLGMEIGAGLYLGRSQNFAILSGSDVDHPFNMQCFTAVRQASGVYGYDVQNPNGTYLLKQSPPGYFGKIEMGGGIEQAYADVTYGWIHGGMYTSSDPDYTFDASVIMGTSQTDLTSLYQDPSWIISPTIQALVIANTDVQNYDGVYDARWEGTDDEVFNSVASALAPILDGPLKDAGTGIYSSFFNPDGSVNDGTPYIPGSPTTITISSVSTAEQGQTITITATLDQPATTDTTITWSATGVTGSLSSPTTVIATDSLSGSVTRTLTGTGTLHVTQTNDQGLTNSSPIDVVVTAPVAPTTYTRTLGTGVALPGVPFNVVFQLDLAATQAVTITPAYSGVSGSYSAATLVIGIGETSGTLTFTATTSGDAVFSSTNNRSLTDPADSSLTVSPASPVTVGGLLKCGIRV